MPRDAFVSYAARDRRHALELCAGLRALGVALWLDVDEPLRRRSWREAVHQGIDDSRTVLIALGPNWSESPACRYELAIAVERHKPLVAMALQRIVPAEALPRGAELIDGGSPERTIRLVGTRLMNHVDRARGGHCGSSASGQSTKSA